MKWTWLFFVVAAISIAASDYAWYIAGTSREATRIQAACESNTDGSVTINGRTYVCLTDDQAKDIVRQFQRLLQLLRQNQQDTQGPTLQKRPLLRSIQFNLEGDFI